MEPIMLVPGLLSSLRAFEPQLADLWRRGPVTVAQTTRGKTIAEIASRILDDAPSRFALAGHSMGGYLALEILRQAPERVTRLALLGTSARPDTHEQTDRRLRLVSLAESGRLDEVVRTLFPLLVHESRHDDASLRRAVDEMAEDVGAAVFVQQQHAIIARVDSRPSLGAIACPTVVVHGEDDNVLPFAHGEELARGIPSAKLVPLSDCGHMLQLERPAEVTRALVEWLEASSR